MATPTRIAVAARQAALGFALRASPRQRLTPLPGTSTAVVVGRQAGAWESWLIARDSHDGEKSFAHGVLRAKSRRFGLRSVLQRQGHIVVADHEMTAATQFRFNMKHALQPIVPDEPPVAAELRPALDPELVRRFHVLMEEVTSELMKGQAHADRRTCRLDAIALLIASCKQLDQSTEAEESPLMYLLIEERQKAAASQPCGGVTSKLAYWKA